MRLTIVYNNEAREKLKSGWGFSCLIEIDSQKLLFDTGDKPEDLLFNMNILGINPKDVSTVVISHNHWDHAGGLDGFMEKNGNKAKVIHPEAFSEPAKITESIYSTGLLKSQGTPDEQSLFIKTKKGLVVVVGCSHPGVDKILDVVKKHGKVHALIGGFHGFDKFDKLAGIDIIGACHCTKHMQEIKSRFPKQFKEIKAGDSIEIE